MTEIEKLIVEIRASFRALGAYGTALHADRGVNASMRAVMEFIDAHGAMSVPDIARAKTVSRQHIQNIVNQLVEGGLAEMQDNPKHKRSSLIALSDKGARTFKEMRKLEKIAFAALARIAPAETIKEARKTLSLLRHEITGMTRKGETHDKS